MGLSVLVIGGAASLYAFAMRRAAQDAQKAAVIAQVQTIADDISQTVRQAVHCDTFTITASSAPFNGSVALRCAMPEFWTDTNADSVPDSYTASWVGGEGSEAYIPSRWTWYIFLSSGYQGGAGQRMLRTTTTSPRQEDLSPGTPSAWDPEFTFQGSGRWRFDRIADFVPSIDSQTRTVGFTLNAQSLAGTVGAPAQAGENGLASAFTLSRSVSWRNGFPGEAKGDGQSLIQNGFFANGATTGWTLSGSAYGVVRWVYGPPTSSSFLLQSNWGNLAGTLVASQSVAVQPNRLYVFGLSAGMYSSAAAHWGGRFMRMRVSLLNAQTSAVIAQYELTDRTWSDDVNTCMQEFAFPFRSGSAASITVRIEDLTDAANSANCDWYIGRFELKELMN